MIIQQISVFLENKAGRAAEITKVLSNEGIDIQSFYIAESSDFGVYRLIVSNVEAAMAALRKAGHAVSLTPVLSVDCPNRPGSLTGILELLASHGLSVDYMYAFIHGDINRAIIRSKDIEACQKVIIGAGIK
ncbi:MAG: ACT domain-containing protein [Bacteroidales bacterium]|nr:ACT domain-containing protein [Bacteroidales bacterium]